MAQVYIMLSNIYHHIYNQIIIKGMQASERHAEHDQTKEDKCYVKLKKQWKDYKLHADLIDALCDEGKSQPKWVQVSMLNIIDNSNGKKINLFVGATHGTGKVMSLLVPILNSIEQIPKNTEDKCQGNVCHNSICKPQSIIIVLTVHLKEKFQGIFRHYQQFGEKRHSEQLRFTISQMDKESHDHGDIIVSIPKHFVYGFHSGKLSLDNCKYIAIYKMDDIFKQEEEALAEILKISQSHQANLIACSCTKKRQLASFFDNHIKDYINISICDIRFSPVGQKLTLKRVKNYYKVAKDKRDMHEYVFGTIFKQLYEQVEKKPQVIVFFDSIEQIREFHDSLKTKVSLYLLRAFASNMKSLPIWRIQQLTQSQPIDMNEDSKQVKITIAEKTSIMTKFRNNETSILLATNKLARGIQIKNACLVISIGLPKASQKATDIDFETYLNRFGRIDRQNHNGLALTLICQEDLQRLVKGVKDIYYVDVLEMKNPEELVNEMWRCVRMNSE